MKKKTLLQKECERDVWLFAAYFFSHHIRKPFGYGHRELFKLQKRAFNKLPLENRPSRRSAIAAPRGAAKSTLKTLVFPIHATLYGHEAYIIILSATLKQARQRLSNIKTELKTNSRLAQYFAEELARKGSWTQDGIHINNTQIDVFSAGTELRGISHGPWRPTLVLLDDIENSRAVRSPRQRDLLHEWYNEVIENIGDSYTAIEIVGTLLHPDSLLAHLLQRPDFESRTFKSIEHYAKRQDLWKKWEALYVNLDDPDRLETARDYFNHHRSEMLRGTRVLWQKKEDYYALMTQKITRGEKAFNKEKQNEPGSTEDAIFDPSRIIQFKSTLDKSHLELIPHSPDNAPIALSNLTIAGFLDSALGKGASQRKGDYSAIATVGLHPTGHYYLLDLWLHRAPPTAQINALFDLHEKWNYAFFGFESNCFQSLLSHPLEAERLRRRQAGRPWQLPLQETNHHQNKELRIATLEPLLANGWLRLAHDLPAPFWTQLQDFPHTDHDDALDALEAAIDLLRSTQTKSKRGPKRKSVRKLSHY